MIPSQDQVGDGMRGVFCLTHLQKLKGNVTEWWDRSHSVGIHFLVTWKARFVFRYIMVTMVVMNVPHGPEKEPDMRFHQMVDCFNFDTLVSLQKYAGRIFKELMGKVNS